MFTFHTFTLSHRIEFIALIIKRLQPLLLHGVITGIGLQFKLYHIMGFEIDEENDFFIINMTYKWAKPDFMQKSDAMFVNTIDFGRKRAEG
jgi:hypothetical protein